MTTKSFRIHLTAPRIPQWVYLVLARPFFVRVLLRFNNPLRHRMYWFTWNIIDYMSDDDQYDYWRQLRRRYFYPHHWQYWQ